MKLITTHELKAGKKLKSRLEDEGELLVTNNGQCMALMLALSPDEDPEETLAVVREAKARRALSRIREQAKRTGADSFDPDQINEIIQQARASG